MYEWPDGSKYIGEYSDDMKHGKGSIEWPDGRKYTGGWEKGYPHGGGVFINAKKKEFHCEWDHGKIISENASKLKGLEYLLGP